MKRIIRILAITLIFLNCSFTEAFAIEQVNNAQELENAMYDHLKNWEKEFSIYYDRNDISDVNKLKDIFENACKKDDYLERSVSGYEILIKGSEEDISVSYRTSAEQEEYIDGELSKIVNNLLSLDMSEIDKLIALNNYLVKIYKYDESLQSNNIYSALTTGKTVCQGYAMTLYKMCKLAGIECRVVIGTFNDVGHAWNLVKINGKWYHIDTTNNDNVVRDKYLLVSDSYLTENGFTWNTSDYPSVFENYYDHSTMYVDYNNDKETDIKEAYNGGYWYKEDNSWYYKRGCGINATGWFKNNQQWYYLGYDGKMQSGWLYDAGNWYFCWSNGTLATNTVVDGYKLNSNGAWVN